MPAVLVVDDSPVDRRLVGGLLGKSVNLRIEYAADGEEALRSMECSTPNLVVTDLIMPNMDGLELVAAVVERYPLVPVILMTGKGSEEIAVQALKAGAASYVPKSVMHSLLLDTVENVLAVAHEEQTQVRLLDCMTGCSFTLDNDATMIPALVNYLRRLIRKTGLCDETDGIRTCVALEEALNNALYHGNLELDSSAREGDRAAYRALVEERRRTEPYRSRKLYVDVNVAPTQGSFVIRDEGPGFDPEKLPDPTDPVNLEKLSGRGLLLMRTFMDGVAFNDRGNQVTLIKKKTSLPSERTEQRMTTPRYFQVERSGDTLVFAAIDSIGGLVEDEARSEWDALLQQLSEQGARNAIMDLGALDYFGSIVLELMVVLWKRVSAQGGKLAVCNVSHVGMEILKTAKFDTIWPIVATRDEALQAIRSRK